MAADSGAWRRDVVAGTMGAVIAVPTLLNCGSVVAQPLGPGHALAGISAAFAAVIVVSLLRAAMGGQPLHLVSPKSTYAAMLAALLTGVVAADGLADAFPQPEQRAGMLMVLCFLCTALAGLIQLALGASRLGAFVKFIPYPVIAGFINGFAILVLLAQTVPMLGAQSWESLWTTGIDAGPAALGLASCAVTLVMPRFKGRIAAALYGLVFGSAAYWLARWGLPEIGWGGTMDSVPTLIPAQPQIADMTRLIGHPAFLEILPDLLATAVMLGLIASLQSLLSISAADASLGTRHDSNRELMLQGGGNLLAGLLGGMATSGSPVVTRAVLDAGGRGPAANLAHGLVLAALAVGLGWAVGLIPISVMAGVVVASTFNQTDDWSRMLLHRLVQPQGRRNSELLVTLGLVATVTGLLVAFGVLPALAAGMTLSFAMFVHQASQSVARRTLSGTGLRSRTYRPSGMAAALQELRHRVVLVEVQGPVFFGTADQLARHLERAAQGCRVVILDMKRVSDIDSSGVVSLERLDNALGKTGSLLFLSYVQEHGTIGQALLGMGFARAVMEGRIFADSDDALAAAEDLLLEEAGIEQDDSRAHGVAGFDLFRGLPPQIVDEITAGLVREHHAPGTAIIRAGDSGDSLYLLAAGRVVVSLPLEGRVLRLAAYSPGVSFGEMGMLTGRPRTADITAETPVICYRMDGAWFRAMAERHPAAGQAILANIAIGLSDLVATLSEMVRELEQ